VLHCVLHNARRLASLPGLINMPSSGPHVAVSPHQLVLLPVACVAIGLPTLLAFNLPPSATYFNQAASLLGWGSWLMQLAAALPERSVRWPEGLVAALCALALLGPAALNSPLWTHLPWSLSLSSVGLLCAAALAVFVGAAVRRAGFATQTFRSLCIALVIAGTASSAIGIVQVFAPQWPDGNWIALSSVPGRAVGNLRQPNHLSSLLLWSLIAVVWLGEVRVLRRVDAWLLAALLLFVVVLSASRTGTVGAALLALWGLLDRRLSRSARALLLLAPVAYALFWFGATSWAQMGQHAFAGAERFSLGGDISSSRFAIWSNTLSLIALHPWAGVGFGEFNFAWTLTPFPDRPTQFFDHTHNLPLHLAVELGLPLAGLVLALLAFALWCAFRNAFQAGGDAQHKPASPLRAAFVMVLMILVHSLLEYPLWYAYFLLPAAFAFGLCLGGPSDLPAASTAAPRATRPLLLASMLLILGSAVSLYDYQRVVVIFAPPEGAPSLDQRIADGQRSWFFSHHADYAAATTAEHPSQAMAAFAGASHYLLDARLMIAWAKALNETGDVERARHVAQRLKEFRNADAEAFFEPCTDAATPAATPTPPFQCLAPVKALTYQDFR
jgi:O-antigen ligase